MLFLGEMGGLAGALLSGWLAGLFRHPLILCAAASLGIAIIVLVIPFGAALPVFQGLAYGGFAFGRDLMLALMLGGSMKLVRATERGSLNATLNAIYQTGATMGGAASAWLYAFRPDFSANAVVAGALLVAAGGLLWRITRLARPEAA
jgi:hypothetical protein